MKATPCTLAEHRHREYMTASVIRVDRSPIQRGKEDVEGSFCAIVEAGRRIITVRRRPGVGMEGSFQASEPTSHRANEKMTSTSASTCLTNDNATSFV